MAEQRSIQIIDKKIRIAIKSGDEVIGEIAFNPDDTALYKKFVTLAEMLLNNGEKMDAVSAEGASLRKTLKTIDDFEDAREVMGKMKRALGSADQVIDEVCAGLDDIFGSGICELFMQGERDIDLLVPLFDVVTPYFKKSRQKKVDKYVAKK